MSAVAVLVLVIGLFFDQNGEQTVETSGTQTVTVREGAVTDAAVMADDTLDTRFEAQKKAFVKNSGLGCGE